VLRTFKVLYELFDVVVCDRGGQSQFSRFNYEGLARRTVGGHQPEAENTVDYFLERSSGAPDLLFEEGSHIVVE
jgi:hypothetical protein